MSWKATRHSRVCRRFPTSSEMEEMYLQDLTNATEIVLDARQGVHRPGEPSREHAPMTSGSGSAGRAVAGAVRIGNTIGAAFNRRVLGAVEAHITLIAGGVLMALSILFAFFPRALAYPLVALAAWVALILLYRSYRLYAQRRRQRQR